MAEDDWYEGRDLDAEWRDSARDRIDEHRKGDLVVEVLDGSGDPVEGAAVAVEQTEHAFGFGTMVDAGLLLGVDDEYDERTQERFREAFTEYFNRGTVNDGFYPWQWGDPDDDQHETGEAAVDWLSERGYPVHGHTILWNEEGRTLPDVEGMDDPERIRDRLLAHVREEVGALAGRVDEWDVINHPVWLNDVWEEYLGGDRGDWVDWLAAARESDPDASLFVNEEAIRDDETGRENDRKYREMLAYLTEHDAEVDGAGFMGHFTPNTLLDPAEVVDWLDAYAGFDLELQITEFDVGQGWHAEHVEGEPPEVEESEWRDLQADYVRDFLTAVVSVPAVTAFVTWGFWEGQMWRPDGAFLTEDFELTPAGEAYADLVYDEWWTEESGETDEAGRFEVRGFAGTYEVEVRDADRVRRTDVSLDDGKTEVVLRD